MSLFIDDRNPALHADLEIAAVRRLPIDRERLASHGGVRHVTSRTSW